MEGQNLKVWDKLVIIVVWKYRHVILFERVLGKTWVHDDRVEKNHALANLLEHGRACRFLLI